MEDIALELGDCKLLTSGGNSSAIVELKKSQVAMSEDYCQSTDVRYRCICYTEDTLGST